MTRRAIYARIFLFSRSFVRALFLFFFFLRVCTREFRTFSDKTIARRNYTSVDGRIPGRRDACTDCVELAALSSESRERRRDARRDGTRSTRMAQARRTIRYRFSSFPLILPALSLSFPSLPLPFSSLLISFSLSSYRSRRWI